MFEGIKNFASYHRPANKRSTVNSILIDLIKGEAKISWNNTQYHKWMDR